MVVGIGIAAVAACVFAFVLLSLTIGYHVRAASSKAIAEHSGDRVTALMAYVSSDSHSLRDRNRATWALGQLGDARALPLLERLHAQHEGEPCDHDRYLCQHELNKAIRACSGGTNLSALIWRHGME
jgi:hypothetical protein